MSCRPRLGNSSALFIKAKSRHVKHGGIPRTLMKSGPAVISAASIRFPKRSQFGRLWYAEPDAISDAIDYAKFHSRSHDAVIRVYDEAGNVIEATSTRASSRSGEVLRDCIHRELVNCPFQFHKRGQLF